jgi:FAD binding domain
MLVDLELFEALEAIVLECLLPVPRPLPPQPGWIDESSSSWSWISNAGLRSTSRVRRSGENVSRRRAIRSVPVIGAVSRGAWGRSTPGFRHAGTPSMLSEKGDSVSEQAQSSSPAVESLGELRGVVAGTVIGPGDASYDGARRCFNALVDRRPAVIVRCFGAADVATAFDYARTHGLEVAVRGGGHNPAGHCVLDGGLVIDLSLMRRVEVDGEARIARSEGGATWLDFDTATQAFGLVTPGGVVGSTGVAGLTFGGGIGHLTAQHGLTCDNLLGAEVVTPDGTVVHAGSDEDDEPLWALRGGGGNFGVRKRRLLRTPGVRRPPVRAHAGGTPAAGRPFRLTFDNKEPAVHNIAIFRGQQRRGRQRVPRAGHPRPEGRGGAGPGAQGRRLLLPLRRPPARDAGQARRQVIVVS